MLEKDHGIYRGIIIHNEDPDHMGRVKVYVPGITNTMYEKWNADVNNDKNFASVDGDLLTILAELREDLPWAEQAQTFFGGDNQHAILNEGEVKVEFERPSDTVTPEDAYGHNTQFTPPKYQLKCSGMYTVPNVGAHVYVFFLYGNTNFPVYFAGVRGESDWNNIYDDDNYPTDTQPYINKHVFNTHKHSLEFVDTDGIETIRLTHFNGSNIQFDNEWVSSYTEGDNFEYILKNKFKTINENQDTHIKKNDTNIIDENKTVTIGKNRTENIGQNESVTVGQNETINIGGNLTITVGQTITITNGSGSITIDPGGNVTIVGTTINLN